MFRVFLFFPVILVVAYLIHAGVKYTRMISDIFLSLVYNPPLEPLPSSPLGEEVTILDSSDREIGALLVESSGSKKVAIFCHESGAGKESWEKYAYFLPSLGFNVLSVDFRARSSESRKNSLSQWPIREDIERLLLVIHWAKRAFYPDIQVVLFGVSNGADIAFAASFEDPTVKAVVADGLFSMKEIFRDYIRKWAPILVRPNFFGENYPGWVVTLFTDLSFWYCQKKTKKRFIDVEKLLRKRHVPLLMIHGQVDDYVPETHQRFLEKISRDKSAVRHLVIPAAKHNEAVVVARHIYEEKITEFLEKMSQT